MKLINILAAVLIGLAAPVLAAGEGDKCTSPSQCWDCSNKAECNNGKCHCIPWGSDIGK